MRKATLCLLLSLFLFTLSGQTIDIGLNLGAALYSGDLSPSDPRELVQTSKPAIGVFCRLANSRKFSTRFNLNYARLFGDDAQTRNADRQLAFETDLIEFNVIGELHTIRIRHTEYSASFPYLFGGIGLFHFNPKREVNGELIELQPLGTEGQGLPGYGTKYNLTQFNIPFGVGMKFTVREFTFGFEIGARYLFTDYLDDVSGTQLNHRDIFNGNGALAAQLSSPVLGGEEGIDQDYFRGSEFDDWYYMMNLTFSYNFGKSIHKMLTDPTPCPW